MNSTSNTGASGVSAALLAVALVLPRLSDGVRDSATPEGSDRVSLSHVDVSRSRRAHAAVWTAAECMAALGGVGAFAAWGVPEAAAAAASRTIGALMLLLRPPPNKLPPPPNVDRLAAGAAVLRGPRKTLAVAAEGVEDGKGRLGPTLSGAAARAAARAGAKRDRAAALGWGNMLARGTLSREGGARNGEAPPNGDACAAGAAALPHGDACAAGAAALPNGDADVAPPNGDAAEEGEGPPNPDAPPNGDGWDPAPPPNAAAAGAGAGGFSDSRACSAG